MSGYPGESRTRVLLIDGNSKTADKISSRIDAYFSRRSLHVGMDCVPSIERALMKMKYFEYDIVLANLKPAKGESSLDFLRIMREKSERIPVILFADKENKKTAADAFELGAVEFVVASGKSLERLPEAVDHNVLKYHALLEHDRLNQDLMEKNRELKVVNETIARQSVRFLKLKKEQEHQRKKMESLLNAMAEGVLFINNNREIEMFNPAAARIFRLDEGDKNFSFSDLTAFIGFDPFDTQPDEEIPVTVFSSDYKVCTSVVEEEEGRGGRILVFHDITREREMEKMKAEFQSMISHELRTPLTAIRGSVENFLHGALGPVTDEQKKFLEMMHGNVKRQTELINDMLDLAKLEARMMSLAVSRVNPEFVARSAYESFRYAFERKGVDLSIETEEGLPKINADERMLSQIMDNLLSNALKFTPQGGKVRIEVKKDCGESSRIDEDKENVFFIVADSGIGVPDDQKEKIFESYYQVDSSSERRFRGTGLGLAISKKMAELHNGSISCVAAEKGGSVFTVTIPVKAAARKKIMLIGKDKKLLETDSEILSREFQLITLDSGKDADKKIEKTLPQLILMDYHIDGMNGFEIFTKIKKNHITSKIPVMFISESMTEMEKVQCFKMGASDFISRPYNAGEFLARVKRVLDPS